MVGRHDATTLKRPIRRWKTRRRKALKVLGTIRNRSSALLNRNRSLRYRRRLALWISPAGATEQSAQVIRHPSTEQIVDENSRFVARATR
jgi:hypothetical protein